MERLQDKVEAGLVVKQEEGLRLQKQEFGANRTSVLFNLIKNIKVLFKIVEFLKFGTD